MGELNSLRDWADVVAISKKLAEGLKFDENTHLVEVVNIMDRTGNCQKNREKSWMPSIRQPESRVYESDSCIL